MDFKFNRKEKAQLIKQDEIYLITSSVGYKFSFQDIKHTFQDTLWRCVFCKELTRRKHKGQFMCHLANPNFHGGLIKIKLTAEDNRLATESDWTLLKQSNEDVQVGEAPIIVDETPTESVDYEEDNIPALEDELEAIPSDMNRRESRECSPTGRMVRRREAKTAANILMANGTRWANMLTHTIEAHLQQHHDTFRSVLTPPMYLQLFGLTPEEPIRPGDIVHE